MALSKIRTNFHANSEALINKQINMELHASYVYMSMVSQVLLFPAIYLQLMIFGIVKPQLTLI